jgi:hypothetical protein
MYCHDDAGKLDSTNPDNSNSGFETRNLMARQSRVINMIGTQRGFIFAKTTYAE